VPHKGLVNDVIADLSFLDSLAKHHRLIGVIVEVQVAYDSFLCFSFDYEIVIIQLLGEIEL